MNSKDIEPLIPRMCIGVMGSAGGQIGETELNLARRLGSSIAKRGYILITGACPGIPHEAVKGAKKEGGIVVGISPALNIEEHVIKYQSPTRGYNAIIYTGSGLMGREIENIRSCDIVIFAGGRSGTLGEFAIAYDEAKLIGILEGINGITEHFRELIDIMKKDTGAIVCYDTDPDCLLDKLEIIHKEHILPQKLRNIEGHNPDGKLQD